MLEATTDGGRLAGWRVADRRLVAAHQRQLDAAAVAELTSLGIGTRAVPLLMTDLDSTAAIAAAALDLASGLRP